MKTCNAIEGNIPACEHEKDEMAEIILNNWRNRNYQYVDVLREQCAKKGVYYDFVMHLGASKMTIERRDC